MEKKFKHRKTGEIIIYKDGVIKSGTFVLDMGCEPSSEYWEEIGEPKEEYSLYYNNLKNGEYYTTEYPNQGLYTFKQGCNLWVAHNHNIIRKTESNLTPQNGFHNFRKATKEEIQMLEPKKGYEILSYKQNISSRLYKKDFNDNFIADNGWSLSKPIDKHTNISIHSIRRLSDGEVFTVGDEINFNNIGYGKLLEIEFESAPADKGTGKLCFVNDNIHLGKWWDISQLSKAKPILFKSRDGFDIREGDKVYGISINWNVFSGVVQKGNLYHREEWKHGKFSTEEAAKEYLMWNKPVLSLKDVASIYPGINKNHNTPSHQAEQLKELVKSKL